MIKRFTLVLLLAFFASPALAAKVQEIKTPQGFTIWLVEEHSLPLISANLTFTGSGLAYDPAGKEGRANLSAALLMEGAGDKNAKTFDAALEENAIHMNIGADDDAIYATLSTLSENKNTAFAMLSDALIRPRFDADAITRTRSKMQVLLVEQSASPSYKLSQAFQKDMYGTHPYMRMGIGTKESLDALSKKDFEEYTHRYITRENMLISIVGDISPADASTLVDQYFSALPAHATPDSTLAESHAPETANQQVVAHAMPQTMVAFGLEGMKREDPDYIAAYVMNYIVGGNGLSSRLAEEIRVKRGLAYTVHTQLDPKMHAGLWRGMFATRNDQVKNALAALRDTLAAIKKEGVTQAELNDAKAYLTGSFILDLSSNQEVANFLAMMQMHHLGSDYLERRNGLIEKVTPEDVRRVTLRLIDPARLHVVMVGQPEL